MTTHAPLTLTAAAAARVNELLNTETPAATALMVGVSTKGCSGMSYTMRLVHAEEAEKLSALPKLQQPLMVKSGAATVYLESSAAMYLLGTEMDFVHDGLHAKFVFNNPNEKGRCGCGESFKV